MAKQEQEDKKVKPKIDLMPKFALERKCFDEAKIRDVRSGKWSTWPYVSINPVTEIGWNQFLGKIVDPDTSEFYPKRDADGKPVKTTPDNIPIYKVVSIMRLKRVDGSEYLLTKGNFIGYNALGDPVTKYVSKPEVWRKTHMIYEKEWDDKRKMIVRNCKGPGTTEDVYTLEFNEKNCKELFDKRENDYIQFIVKEEHSGTAKVVSGVNIHETYKLFLNPNFAYLFNAEYMTPEMKAYYRQEAIDAGILSPPPTSSTAPPNAYNPNANSPRMHLG